MDETLKIGELARRSGLTVRALHHWDEVGLLRPSQRTAAGHRLYDAGDVARLHQIRSLRFLGFGLDEIERLLARPQQHLAALIAARLGELEAQIELARSLKLKLEKFSRQLAAGEELPLEEMLNQLEMMSMYEKYYTPDQLEHLEQRRRELGDDAIAAVEQEWPRLIAEVQALRAAGVPAEDPRAAALARRWSELVAAFTGGDRGIAAAVGQLIEQEDGQRAQMGLDRELLAYVRAAQRTGEDVRG